MAKKRKDSQEEDNVFQEGEAPKQEQFQLGDCSSLKRALDEAVIEVRRREGSA